MSVASLDEAPPDEVADKGPSFRKLGWNLSSMDMAERRIPRLSLKPLKQRQNIRWYEENVVELIVDRQTLTSSDPVRLLDSIVENWGWE